MAENIFFTVGLWLRSAKNKGSVLPSVMTKIGINITDQLLCEN